jgi:hypothetical protein
VISDKLRRLKAEIDRLERFVSVYGEDTYNTLEAHDYDWPVFGSRRCSDADTPEAYFDWCGTDIRRSGSVILHAAVSRARLPDGLAASMAGGQGLSLLKKFAEKRPPIQAPAQAAALLAAQ